MPIYRRHSNSLLSLIFYFTHPSHFSHPPHHHKHNSISQHFLEPKVVTERIIAVIQNFEKVAAIKNKVTPTARFKEDLDLDSLDAVEVVMAVEEEFAIEIPDSEADKIWSVADAVAYVSGHPMAK